VTPNEWAAMGVAIVTLISSFALFMRFMVKSIMRELLPNHGTSLRDQISRIEARLDHLYDVIVESSRD
jgi:hypothetical protein